MRDTLFLFAFVRRRLQEVCSYSIKNTRKKNILEKKKGRKRKTFLKNLSHISSRTRLIKNIFEDMHAQKMGKLNLWLFLTEIFKWYQNASLTVHNEMSRMRLFFHMRSFLSIFAKNIKKNIIYCIRFCFISFISVLRSCGLWKEDTTSVLRYI